MEPPPQEQAPGVAAATAEVPEGAVEHPVVFISYSWTSPEHKDWVRDLAFELRTVWRLDVRLDRWHLRSGEDLLHFMERSITEADKVLIVSDCTYAEKANARRGSVGIEAQILTPRLYAEVGGEDDSGPLPKFAVATTEDDDDGRACRPTFYGGRVYIDLSEPAERAEKVRDVAMWAYNVQEEQAPPISGSPDFLSDEPTTGTYAAASAARRALDGSRPEARRLTESYFATLAQQLTVFVPEAEQPLSNDGVVEAAVRTSEALGSTYDEAVSVFDALAQADLGRHAHRALRALFTALAPYALDMERIPDGRRPEGWQRAPFRPFIEDLFRAATAALLSADDVESIVALTATPYPLEAERRESRRLEFPALASVTHDTWLREPVQKARAARWPPDRLLSLAQADFVLLLSSAQLAGGAAAIARDYRRAWWPHVLLGQPMYYRVNTLPAFTEAESKTNLARLALAVGTDADGLVSLLDQFIDASDNGSFGIPDIGYKRLSGYARLGTRP